MHNIDLILTLAGGLTAALTLGFITQKLRMSPLVGYLLAGIIVGPYSPGFVADADTASQCAEIGIILLMFGVGLHFHLKDLLAVQRIVLPGAVAQITAATLLGMLVSHGFGWSWGAGAVFGMAISVASTVVLTRVLADNKALHTTTGHVALGWLVVEDLFTILLLVLLPAVVGGTEIAENVWHILGITTLKLAALVVFALVVGQRVIPTLLAYVARTGTRDLFTLAVLVMALGVAVAAASFFGASMALGAFLGGMVVGQSEFSARAAAEALPMRDAFAVLFFVSVGMLFNPASLITEWPLILATLGIVLLGKPLAAFLMVKLFGKPLRMALSVAVALAQIGEFSFILAAMGVSFGVLPPEASSAIIVTAIISITLNPLLYRRIETVAHWLESKGIGLPHLEEADLHPTGAQRIIVVGYGPVGRHLTRILRDNNLDVVVVEMNIDTVQRQSAKGEKIIYGDATQREVLVHAGAEEAEGLIVSSSSAPAGEIVEVARSINPNMRILVHTTYLSVAENLKHEGASAVFSGEREVAVAMTEYLMRDFGATDEQIERERRALRESM
ncbi:MAG TPA: cation:proton antiporter [Candidatus Bilophila faecipullorum]|uniref:Cation:proton antiporter n=1 Tax=Candidatus Bilophila faecipullorum TaxID=2838482 RepID=A0A9D1R2F7_9BACT|nr:cation:proton antiporter [uncultured Bilophila sp.]HIW79719.1 cation:proton antiporter [Candidatus Bilophila faecipullorum]